MHAPTWWYTRWCRRASSIWRMVKGSLANDAFAEFRICRTMKTVDPPSKWREENFSLRVQLCREFCRVAAHPRSKVFACENLQERALEISSHADRLSPLATPREAPPLLLSTVFLSSPFFLSFLLFLLFFAFWVWRESRSREGFFFSKLKPRVFREARNEGSSSVEENWFALWLSMVE